MITENIKDFVEKTGLAYVASSDRSGRPHLAAVKGLTVPDPRHIVFSEWFCPKTIENISANPEIAVAVMDPGTGKGYQFVGMVEKTVDVGILDGYDPGIDKTVTPQVLYQVAVLVGEIMEFTHGVHTDRAMSASG